MSSPAQEISPGLPSDAGTAQKRGVLPGQELKALIRKDWISADIPIAEDQIQPASLDLRLGNTAYRLPASFLPGRRLVQGDTSEAEQSVVQTVQEKVDSFAMHEFDLAGGAVLERGCVYLIPLLESVRLGRYYSAITNPKSSTGRLDVFARVIADGVMAFDSFSEYNAGPLWVEVSPRSFSVLVRTGDRLVQMRVRSTCACGDPPRPETRKVPVSVDTEGAGAGALIGYRAKKHSSLIDLSKIGHYDPDDFWEPIKARKGDGLVLDPDEFYILASREPVSVPPDEAAEMVAYDTMVGEFRVHYAGFFDPGFGHDAAGGAGSRAVLEVRSHDVPFLLEHGQLVGHLLFEPLTAKPERLYGADMGSNYQRQGLKLSKHFKAPDGARQ